MCEQNKQRSFDGVTQADRGDYPGRIHSVSDPWVERPGWDKLNEPMQTGSTRCSTTNANPSRPVFRCEKAREGSEIETRIRVAIEGVDLHLAMNALNHVIQQVDEQNRLL